MDIRNNVWRQSEKLRKRSLTVQFLAVCGLLIQADILLKGLLVNGQAVSSKEANSSPSKITAIKGSSVWLHWSYTYVGDGAHSGIFPVTTYYREQIIGFSSISQPSIQVIAKRIGQNGVLILQSSIPAPFNGRVEMIASNSTLVIHDLQYNDSSYQFSSNVNVDIEIDDRAENRLFHLKPTISVTIYGIPNFIIQPPSIVYVNEDSKMELKIEMDGNPKPSAEFKWSHLSLPKNISSVKMHPFVYSLTYTLNITDGRYCGRILHITLKNSIGSSSVKNTTVSMLLPLDRPFHLRARKFAESKCVEVKWNKVESGACIVRYDVKLKDAFGNNAYNETGYNIGKAKICNLTVFANVTEVKLTISYRNISKNVTTMVSEGPAVPPTSGKTSSIPKTATIKAMPPDHSTRSMTSESDANIGLITVSSFVGLIFHMADISLVL